MANDSPKNRFSAAPIASGTAYCQHSHCGADELGTREFFVVHHTDCGMQFFTNEGIRGLLASSLETAELRADGFHGVGKAPGSRAAEFIEWLPFSDSEQSAVDDVERIRHHPLVSGTIPIYGYIYDVKTGRLNEVNAAMHVGAAKPAQSPERIASRVR